VDSFPAEPYETSRPDVLARPLVLPGASGMPETDALDRRLTYAGGMGRPPQIAAFVPVYASAWQLDDGEPWLTELAHFLEASAPVTMERA